MGEALTRRSHTLGDLIGASSVAEWLRAAGNAAGMREMALETAQASLETRFGPLAADELEALQTADEAPLREVVAQVAGVSQEQRRAQLGLR
jgi:hypothetical protein